MKKKCKQCGNELIRKNGDSHYNKRIFCSHKCSGEFRKRHSFKRCLTCGEKFFGIPWQLKKRKYCDLKCMQYKHGAPITQNCLLCGKEFSGLPSKLRNKRYCSRYCGIRNIRTEEHKKLMSKIMKGYKPTEETKRKISKKIKWMYENDKEYRRKFKESNIHRSLPGKLNPNWQGGLDRHSYGWEFNDKLKDKIKQRDKFICQLCKNEILKQTKNKFLTVHHIDYNKKNNKENNLICLCNFCNSSVNTSREQWRVFFQNKLQEVKPHG